MSETLTKRIEACLDRWNMLPIVQRHALSGKATAASLGLGDLVRLHRELSANVADLEQKLDRAEVTVRDEDETTAGG
jgi:hypothetical protein